MIALRILICGCTYICTYIAAIIWRILIVKSLVWSQWTKVGALGQASMALGFSK